jgi:hypothetical protein
MKSRPADPEIRTPGIFCTDDATDSAFKIPAIYFIAGEYLLNDGSRFHNIAEYGS